MTAIELKKIGKRLSRADLKKRPFQPVTASCNRCEFGACPGCEGRGCLRCFWSGRCKKCDGEGWVTL